MEAQAFITQADALSAEARAAEAAGKPALALYRAANDLLVKAIEAQGAEIVQTCAQTRATLTALLGRR